MFRVCCVTGCGSRRDSVTLFKFRKTEIGLQNWFKCIPDVNVSDLSDAELGKFYICKKHFEKRFLTPKSRLIMGAYPSLFTQEEINSGVPSAPIDSSNFSSVHDHTYAADRHELTDHTYCKSIKASLSDTNLSSSMMPQPSCSKLPDVTRGPLTEVSGVEMRHDNLEMEVCVETSTDTKHSSSLSMTEMPQPSCSKLPDVTIGPQMGYGDMEMEVSTETLMGEVSAGSGREMIATPTTTAVTYKTTRRRIITKFNNLTPTCKKIYKEFVKAKKQADFQRRAKMATKFSKKYNFEEKFKNLNPYAQKFIEMQLNLCTKTKKGRRFTMEQKLIALAIMKQGPKSYRFLHKIFILPSKATLNKMISNLNMEAGINQRVLGLIKKEVDSWPNAKKHCCIIFDEMALDMGLSYDRKKDYIHGFLHLNERKKRFADHVLVFMARGAVYKWQQPLGFYFCEGATSGPELKEILKQMVTAVAQTGLNPLALCSDQGTSFVSALRSLQQDTRANQLRLNQPTDDTIVIGQSTMNIIYDPSHLIKGIRNNFLTKDIKYKNKVSRWKDIVDVYMTDGENTNIRLLHKLNDTHVIPEKIKKMKVKNCVRVLSKTVAAALMYTSQFGTYADGTPVSTTLKNTADTVSFFDDLFDSINGATVSMKSAKGKPLRTAVQETSQHREFWLEAIKRLEDMKFLDKGVEKSVPTQRNFVTTLKSYMNLWQVFKGDKLKIMRPRYFNTDPIENFFGQTRAYNYRSNNPTCHSFINTYKALAITRLINFHSDSYNCEDDPADQLINLQSLFENENIDNNQCVQDDEKDLPGPSNVNVDVNVERVESLVQKARKERLNVHSSAYCTGWVVKKILHFTANCTNCRSGLTSNPESTIHNWLSHREYKECQKKVKLYYPSSTAVRHFRTAMTHTNKYLEANGHNTNILKNINTRLISKYKFDLVECTDHQHLVTQLFVNITVRFSINNWCNRLNHILKGNDIVRLQRANLTGMSQLAYHKYKKKLKNKSHGK